MSAIKFNTENAGAFNNILASAMYSDNRVTMKTVVKSSLISRTLKPGVLYTHESSIINWGADSTAGFLEKELKGFRASGLYEEVNIWAIEGEENRARLVFKLTQKGINLAHELKWRLVKATIKA